jgi:hypothetical protein
MIKRLEKWFLGAPIIYVKQSSLLGAKVIMVDREEYELMVRRMTWQTLRAFLLGVVLVTAVGLGTFTAGVRVGWTTDIQTFKVMCTRAINSACSNWDPIVLSPRSPFKKQYFGATPIVNEKVIPWELIDVKGCLKEPPK